MRENLIRACYGGYTKQTKTKNLSGANYRIVGRIEWFLPFRFDCFLLRREFASLYSASVKKPDPEQRFFFGRGTSEFRLRRIFCVGERSEKPQTHTADDATDKGR